MKKVIICIIILFFLITTGVATSNINQPSVLIKDNEVKCNSFFSRESNQYLSEIINQGRVINLNTTKSYDEIQDSIDDQETKDGHWIYVKDEGTYKQVEITKSLIIYGSDDIPTIVGDGTGTLVSILNNSVNIRNFELINGGESIWDAGIFLNSVTDTILENLQISHVHQGIFFEESSNISLKNISFNDCSITIYGEKPEHYLHNMENVEINGYPLCYYREKENIFVPSNCKSAIITQCNNVTLGIQSIGLNGIVDVSFSSNVTISDSAISDNDFAISLINTENCIIKDSTLSSNRLIAISIDGCSGIEINNNYIHSNEAYGIYLNNSSSCKIINNNRLEDNKNGIFLQNSNDMIIENNRFTNNGLKIIGEFLDHFIHKINDNTINNKELAYYKNDYGPHPDPSKVGMVIFVNCTKGTLEGFTSVSGDVGFQSAFCNNTEIENSIFTNCDYGIYSYSCIDSEIRNCKFSDCDYGLAFDKCSNEIIYNNNQISNINYYGIYLENSDNCIIINNNITENQGSGIRLENSPYNRLLDNYLDSNKNHGVEMIYSSDNCTIENNSITGTGWENSGGDGIYINGCNGCHIIYNQDISSCFGEGIWLQQGENNKILYNNIRYNKGNGIQIVQSTNNEIKYNYICKNHWGIRKDNNSDSNQIWNNYFMWNGGRLIDLLPQRGGNAIDDGVDDWNYTLYDPNTGKLTGGNYWSDWQPQWIPGLKDDNSDGVVDQPYSIPDSSGGTGNSTDHYPKVLDCFIKDEDSPQCEIRYPIEGKFYLGGIPIGNTLRGNTVVIGNIPIIVYAEDIPIGGFASDHVEVVFKLNDKEMYICPELNWRFEALWSAWSGENLFGNYNLKVIARDKCGKERTDSMTLFIINFPILNYI